MIPGTIPSFASSQAPTLEYLGSDTDSADRSTYTFSSFNFGEASTDRLIVVAYSGARSAGINLSSATIGGVTATPIIEQTALYGSAFVVAGLIAAVVPSGTTGSIVIRYNSTAAKCGIGAWSMKNLLSTTVAATNSGGASGGAIDLSLDTQIGDLIVASSYVNATTGESWTGLTENFDGTLDTNGRQSGASATASSAETPRTITGTNTSNSVGVSASWR